MKPTTDQILAQISKAGRKPFPYVKGKGGINLNIVGLRTKPGTPNRFDDWICLVWQLEDGSWESRAYPATTDPGRAWLEKPGRENGCAILVPGFYSGCWKIGKHKGQYSALVQSKSGVFKNWRDNSKDGIPDYSGPVFFDVAGLNMHHAGKESTFVELWSAACQVFAKLSDWVEAWEIITRSARTFGDTFSYLLVDYSES